MSEENVEGSLRTRFTPPCDTRAVARRARRSRRGKKSKVELLGNVRLFSTCNKRELARIASLVDEVDAPKGKVIVRQGDPGRECFVIADGKAKATIRGKSSALLGPGSFFGEMSLLDQGPRSATVTAETDLHLLVLGSREFSSLVHEVPTVAVRMMQGLAERLRSAERPQAQH
jgi:CRP/FNR family cyclic AMP-dependent transcriptional regulator